jgi:Asp-tRNA(Asn)/Glu-tRNA(Gln) amidotransferase A subunit family amidase
VSGALELCDQTATELADGLRAGEISSVGILDACLERVASGILEGYRPPYTATAVRNLAAAGAPVLGKTNMDEFAMGSSNENSGFGPVRNPWDLAMVPGGSSGGSAAAVAAGEAVWALGTDTGGSVRQPASLCGVVGLKPTYGLISRYGLIAFASSLDAVGTFTRSVRDAAVLLSCIAGKDPMDATSLDTPRRDYTKGLEEGISGLRVGVVTEAFGEGVEPGVRSSVRGERFDLLVSPTSPTTAFPIGAKIDDPLAMYLNDVFTIPANLSGMPAISIPSGLDDAGLPVGVQLTAPVLEESRLLRAAFALEQPIGFDARPPTVAEAPS